MFREAIHTLSQPTQSVNLQLIHPSLHAFSTAFPLIGMHWVWNPEYPKTIHTDTRKNSTRVPSIRIWDCLAVRQQCQHLPPSCTSWHCVANSHCRQTEKTFKWYKGVLFLVKCFTKQIQVTSAFIGVHNNKLLFKNRVVNNIHQKKQQESNFPTWLTGCELIWDVSVSPAAETKTSFSDCGATVQVEDDALWAEERPVVRKSYEILSEIN